MLVPWRVSIFKLQIPRWDPMRLGVDHMPESEHDFVGQSRMKNEQTITHLFHGVSHYPPFTPPSTYLFSSYFKAMFVSSVFRK